MTQIIANLLNISTTTYNNNSVTIEKNSKITNYVQEKTDCATSFFTVRLEPVSILGHYSAIPQSTTI